MSDYVGELGVLPGTTANVDPSSASPIAGDAGAALGTGTGQHGLLPANLGGPAVGNALQEVWDFLNKPFTTNMSMWDVALLVGVIMVAVIAWNLILYHIRIAAETI